MKAQITTGTITSDANIQGGTNVIEAYNFYNDGAAHGGPLGTFTPDLVPNPTINGTTYRAWPAILSLPYSSTMGTHTGMLGANASGTTPGFSLNNTIAVENRTTPFVNTDPAYGLLLSGLVFRGSTTPALTLTGLTIGQTYTAQLTFDDSDPRMGDTITDTTTAQSATIANPSGINAYFLNDTFTATGTTNTLNFTLSGFYGQVHLDGFSVSSVPEPRAETAMLLGAGALVASQVFRRRRA